MLIISIIISTRMKFFIYRKKIGPILITWPYYDVIAHVTKFSKFVKEWFQKVCDILFGRKYHQFWFFLNILTRNERIDFKFCPWLGMTILRLCRYVDFTICDNLAVNRGIGVWVNIKSYAQQMKKISLKHLSHILMLSSEIKMWSCFQP